ncbi:MAG: hypothetical protein C0483_16835 [Pirellula sp.]|nr:hypothetical protein [Pirellula sp.]
MRLLIDGYNLMYAAGIVGPPGRGAGGLERSRAALIQFVASTLEVGDKSSAVVVFDAAGAPPGLPHTLFIDGVTIRFAKGYSDADELLEELIATNNTPRRLTVVSSDHRVQRAARRRKATAVDSDVWYDTALRKRTNRGTASLEDPSKPGAAVNDAEVEFWLRRLVGDDEAAPNSPWGDIFPPGYGDDVEDKDADD